MMEAQNESPYSAPPAAHHASQQHRQAAIPGQQPLLHPQSQPQASSLPSHATNGSHQQQQQQQHDSAVYQPLQPQQWQQQQHQPALPAAAASPHYLPPPVFSPTAAKPRPALPSSSSSSSSYRPPPPSTFAGPAALFFSADTAPPLPLTVAVLFNVVFLFLTSSASSPLVLCLSGGLLLTFLLASLQLPELSALAFMMTTTCFSCLLLFFHTAPDTASAFFSLCFLLLNYTALLLFVLFFLVSSPFTSRLMPATATDLMLLVLYSTLPLLTSALTSLMLLPLTAVANCAFYYLAILAAFIRLLLFPLGPVSAPAPLPPLLLYFNCWMLIFTPCVLHCLVHVAAPVSLSFVADFVILLTAPFLLLAIMSRLTPLSASPFTGALYSTQQEKERREVAVGFLSAFVLLGCLEYRVVIVSFSSLLYYHASSPLFSTLLLTVCLYSGLTAVILLSTILSSSAASPASRSQVVAFHVSVLVAALSLALSLGLLFLIPLLPVVSYAFSSFFFTRSLLSYCGFLLSVLLALLYLAYQHLWFLTVEVGSGVSVSSLSVLMIALAVLALLLPALPLIPLPSLLSIYSHSTSFLLLLHVSCFSLLEFVLYASNAAYPTPVYPVAFPVLTAALTLWVVRQLQASGRLNRFSFSLLLSLTLSKLAMLTVDTLTDYVHAVVIAIAVTSPFTMYTRRMHWLLAVGHAALIAVALLLAKNTVIAHLMRIAGVETVTESSFVSAYLLLTLAALLPLSAPYARWRRLNLLLLALSAVFAVIQPRLPSALFSGESDVFDAAQEDEVSYSSWLLIAGAALLLTGMGAASGPVLRVAAVVAGSLSLCVYLCAEYLPVSFALYLFFTVIFVSAGLMCALVASASQLQSVSVYPVLVVLIALYCTAYPLTFMATSLLFTTRGYSLEEMEQSRIVLFTAYTALSLAASVVVNYYRLTAASVPPPPPPQQHAGVRPPPAFSTSGFSLSASDDPQAALITISNLLLLVSYLSSAMLLLHYLHESDAALLFLSPLLLFIQYEHAPELKEHAPASAFTAPANQSRYLPMVGLTSLLLLLSALSSILHPLLAPLHALTPHESLQWSASFAVIHALYLLPAFPLLAAAVYGMWLSRYDWRHLTVLLSVCCPLCIIAAVLSSLDSVRLLNALAVMLGMWLVWAAQQRTGKSWRDWVQLEL